MSLVQPPRTKEARKTVKRNENSGRLIAMGAVTLSDALRNVPRITIQAGEGGGASNTTGDMRGKAMYFNWQHVFGVWTLVPLFLVSCSRRR